MTRCTRRNLFKLAGAGSLALLLPALTRFGSTPVMAQDRLDPESAQAKALGYVHHHEDVDAEQWPRYEEGQSCATCQLSQDNDEAEWIACDIFPGKQVNRDGWCNSWVQQQG